MKLHLSATIDSDRNPATVAHVIMRALEDWYMEVGELSVIEPKPPTVPTHCELLAAVYAACEAAMQAGCESADIKAHAATACWDNCLEAQSQAVRYELADVQGGDRE